MTEPASKSVVALTDYGAHLNNFFLRKGASDEEAADLVQDVCVRIIVYERKRKIDHLYSFMMTMANNLWVDHLRRGTSRQRQKHVDIDGVELRSDMPPQDRSVHDQQQFDLVRRAIAELPDSCQSALKLHRFEAKSYSEISEILGVSVSMVQKHISRALAELRKTLDNYE